MRRVLIIHYHFLPVHNVAVRQLIGYIRQLPAFGWEPVVLTRDWREKRDMHDEDPSWGLSWEPDIERELGVTVHRVAAPPRRRTPSPGRVEPWPIRKIQALAPMLLGSYPDELMGWANPALEAARALAQSHRLHAVITYCPPETNHVVGSRLARAVGIPVVPFFGDLYGFFLASLPQRTVYAAVRRVTHQRWMKSVAACIAVSPYMAEYLSATYGKRVELVLAGYDPGEFPVTPVSAASQRARCLVSHVGSLYPGDQLPGIFFDGLDRFLDLHPDAAALLDVRFVGSKCDGQLRHLIHGRPSARVCTILAKVESPRATAMVRESDVLLAFNCTKFRDRHGTMSYPTKIFEAFGARRPILAMPPDGDWVDALLARTGAGVAAGDAQGVAAVLSEWFSAWRTHGEVPYHGRPEVLEEFTTARQTERLAGILDVVSSGWRRSEPDCGMPLSPGSYNLPQSLMFRRHTRKYIKTPLEMVFSEQKAQWTQSNATTIDLWRSLAGSELNACGNDGQDVRKLLMMRLNRRAVS